MKMFASIFSVVLAVACSTNPVSKDETVFKSGKGTESEPYLIASAADLEKMVSVVNEGKGNYPAAVYSQTADIDGAVLKNHIGSKSDCRFCGKYYGNGHKITNVSFSATTDEPGQGIFGCTDGALIDGVNVDGYTNVSGNDCHGVIVGLATNTTVSKCSVKGNISIKSPSAGAVVGCCGEGCLVSECSFDGTIAGEALCVGGIVGLVKGTSIIDRCRTSGEVSGLYNVGGIVGFAEGSGLSVNIVNCACSDCRILATGADSANHYARVGGIVGGINKSEINLSNSCALRVTICCNDSGDAQGKVSGLGGIIGSMYGTGMISVCYSTLKDSDVVVPNGRPAYCGAVAGYKFTTCTLASTNWYDASCSYGAYCLSNACNGIASSSFTNGNLRGELNNAATHVDGARKWIADDNGYPVPFGDAVTPVEPPKTIRILAIGNSFTEDAVEQNLYELFADAGVDAVIANCYIGGCTLETHWNNENSTDDSKKNSNSYRKVVRGAKTTTANVSIAYILQDEPWDFVIFQQGHGYYGKIDTHYPYIDNFIAYLAKYLKKDSYKVGYQMTWALPDNTTSSYYAYYNSNQMTMYRACADCAKTLKERSGLDIIIPTGTAIQNGRTSSLGDSFNRDWGHLEKSYGRFTAACTWFETISGVDVRTNGYKPSTLNDAMATMCRKFAHDAVQNPYDVTNQ